MLDKTPIEVRAAASPALLEKGCVDVVSLEGIRLEAADRWPRIREGVYARMEALLRQKLGPTDFFTRIDEVSYLVTMPAANPDDVHVVCLRVAYDVYTCFIGQCSIGKVHVFQAASGQDEAIALKPLNTDTIVRLAEKAGITEFHGTTYSTKSPVTTLSGYRATTGASSPHDAGCTVNSQFIPLWAAPTSVITTYICEPRSVTSHTGLPLLVPQLPEKDQLHVELSCMHTGIDHLSRCSRQGRFLLGVTTSFEVLGSPAGRMEFLSTCHELSSEYRQYLDFYIVRVPPGVAQTRLANMVNVLRPFGRSVSATVAPGSRVYNQYQGIGLRSVGLDLREYPGTGFSPVDDLRQVAVGSKAMKLGTFLFDVHNKTTLAAARQANIQMLSGPAIAPPCEVPAGMWRLSWDNVLSERNVENI